VIGKKLISSEVIPLYEVKDMLKQRSQKGELTYEQNITDGYAKKFTKITRAKGEKLIDELKKVEGLDDKLAIKIADILPNDIDRLNLIIPKNVILGEGIPQQIVELVKKFVKK